MLYFSKRRRDTFENRISICSVCICVFFWDLNLLGKVFRCTTRPVCVRRLWLFYSLVTQRNIILWKLIEDRYDLKGWEKTLSVSCRSSECSGQMIRSRWFITFRRFVVFVLPSVLSNSSSSLNLLKLPPLSQCLTASKQEVIEYQREAVRFRVAQDVSKTEGAWLHEPRHPSPATLHVSPVWLE